MEIECFLLNWKEIIIILTPLITHFLASLIARFTPNEVQSQWLGTFLKIIDIVALSTKPTIVTKPNYLTNIK